MNHFNMQVSKPVPIFRVRLRECETQPPDGPATAQSICILDKVLHYLYSPIHNLLFPTGKSVTSILFLSRSGMLGGLSLRT